MYINPRYVHNNASIWRIKQNKMLSDAIRTRTMNTVCYSIILRYTWQLS